MKGIVHPLAEELGDLVETGGSEQLGSAYVERDGSWLWMLAIVAVIGLFAWFTR